MRAFNFLLNFTSLLKPCLWLTIGFLISFLNLYKIIILLFLFLGIIFSFYFQKKKVILIIVFYVLGLLLGGISFYRNARPLTPEDIGYAFNDYPQRVKLLLTLQEDSFLTSKGYQAGKVIISSSEDSFFNKKTAILLGFFPSIFKGDQVFLEILIEEDWKGRDFIYFWVDKPSSLERLPSSFLNQLREKVLRSFDNFNNSLSPLVSDWILALFQGERSFVLEREKDLFTQVGLIHLLALSGFHLGFWTFGLSFLLSLFLPRKIINLLLPFLLILYLLSVGLYPSLVRAWFFVVIIMFYNFNYFKKDPISMISLTMVLSLSFFPYLFYTLGFWLSLSAFSAIVLDRTGSFITISLRIFIFTSPFLLFAFGGVPLVGFLLTPPVSFLVSIFMFSSFILYLIYWIPPLSYIFYFLDYFLSLIINLIEFIVKISLPFNIFIEWRGFFIILAFYGLFIFLSLYFRIKAFLQENEENLKYEN